VPAGQPAGGRSVNFSPDRRATRCTRSAFAGAVGAGADKAGLSKVPPAPEPRGQRRAPLAGEGGPSCSDARAVRLALLVAFFLVWVGMTVWGSIAASSCLDWRVVRTTCFPRARQFRASRAFRPLARRGAARAARACQLPVRNDRSISAPRSRAAKGRTRATPRARADRCHATRLKQVPPTTGLAHVAPVSLSRPTTVREARCSLARHADPPITAEACCSLARRADPPTTAEARCSLARRADPPITTGQVSFQIYVGRSREGVSRRGTLDAGERSRRLAPQISQKNPTVSRVGVLRATQERGPSEGVNVRRRRLISGAHGTVAADFPTGQPPSRNA